MRSAAGIFTAVMAAFFGGFLSHVLYQRWNPAPPESQTSTTVIESQPAPGGEPPSFAVKFSPLPTTDAAGNAGDLTPIVARDVEKIRALTGRQARIRGRVFRVGHSAKSNTYFLNFGPSREALTAVIFNSAAELFDRDKLIPKQFENREVEIVGFVKDHPQYGLEVVLEHPKQIKILN
jgi:hypothetical protein